MIINIDWKHDIQELVSNYFRSLGVNYSPKCEVSDSLIDFFNHEMKLISLMPRRVYISDKIKTRKIPIDNFLALLTIERKIRNGESVLYHQSKGVLNPIKTDDLLNDWLIQHLHISDWKTNSSDNFFARTKDVLFVVFSNNEAFFIDIRPHGKNGEPDVFAKKELLEIIDNNWPRVLEKYYWKGVSRVSPELEDKDIAVLRSRGYTIGAYNINGKAIRSPGIAISTSGHNISVIKKSDWVIRYLHSAHQYAIGEVEVEKVLKEITQKEMRHLDLSVKMLDRWPFFALYESNSKCFIEEGKIIPEHLA